MSNNSESPQVTWLLCTNQDGDSLRRAIESCLHQTIDLYELLLIANGPDADKIAETLSNTYKENERIRVISTPVHYLNFSLNLGLHLARSPYIARMDSDDVAHKDRLAQQLAFMKNNKDVAVLGSSYFLINEECITIAKIDVPCTDKEIRSSLWIRNPICHPSVMLRREAILEMGGYIGGRNSEDYDLWLRLASTKKWRLANLQEPLLFYNMTPSGQARRSRAAYANVAGTQLRQFLETRDPRWLIGAALSSMKSFLLAKRP